MQMVHYIWTYLRVMEKIGKIPGDPDAVLDIIVPTGVSVSVKSRIKDKDSCRLKLKASHFSKS